MEQRPVGGSADRARFLAGSLRRAPGSRAGPFGWIVMRGRPRRCRPTSVTSSRSNRAREGTLSDHRAGRAALTRLPGAVPRRPP